MKHKYNLLKTILLLVLTSCSSTISKQKKEYKITKISQLKSDWNINSKEWFMKNDTLIGTGGLMHWGVIESKKKLSRNYEITLQVNMTKGSLFEIMLNSEKEKYIRGYLYLIDQNVVIGNGTFIEGSDEYSKRGGPSVLTKSMKVENNKWYLIKIRFFDQKLFFSVDNETTLECYVEKNNLSKQGKLGFLTNGEVQIIDLRIKNI